MPDDASLESTVRAAFAGQYHGALAMLRATIEACPDQLWAADGDGAPFWRVAYHALYYTHLYLQPADTDFRPWPRHQTGLQDLDDIPTEDPELQRILELPHRPPRTGTPLTRAAVLEYWALCDAMVDPAMAALDVHAQTTGFRWHAPQRSKVALQVSTIRHIQHHTAQLSARLRAATGHGVDWVGASAAHSPEA